MDATVIDPAKQAAAADPATPLETLAELAHESAELRLVVAANPSTYSDLLDWMRALGEPALTAVIAARTASTPVPDATIPAYVPIAAAPAASAVSGTTLTADRRLVYLAGAASIALITVVLVICGIVSAVAAANYPY